MPLTNVKPFNALVYNQDKIRDISRVVCPPYDVISPAEQDFYHDLDPYNLIHVLLRKDIQGEDKYRRAGTIFRDWQKESILIQEEKPAIYFYSQQFRVRGEEKNRRGFIALLRLADENSAVFGHENTRLPAKEDRLKLLKQVKANLSPIFSVFEDKKRIINRIFEKHIKDLEPLISVKDKEKTVHKLWSVDSPEILASIKDSLSKENVFIADGHHRYEVACAYRSQEKQKSGEAYTGEEPFNYILSYFTNTDPRGLCILPIHRLISLDKKFDFKDFIAKLKSYFDIDEIKEKDRFFFLLEKGGRTEHLIGMYKDRRQFLLRLKNIKIIDSQIQNKPKEYKSLDVCILNTLILQRILGLDVENKEIIQFSPDAESFIKAVDSSSSQIAFFMNPVRFEQISALAIKGERMPSKSTYFYPKVLSGLVINKLE